MGSAARIGSEKMGCPTRNRRHLEIVLNRRVSQRDFGSGPSGEWGARRLRTAPTAAPVASKLSASAERRQDRADRASAPRGKAHSVQAAPDPPTAATPARGGRRERLNDMYREQLRSEYASTPDSSAVANTSRPAMKEAIRHGKARALQTERRPTRYGPTAWAARTPRAPRGAICQLPSILVRVGGAVLHREPRRRSTCARARCSHTMAPTPSVPIPTPIRMSHSPKPAPQAPPPRQPSQRDGRERAGGL